MLEAFDRRHKVSAHDDYFGQATSDIEWLASIGCWSPKPVVICGDGRILKNKAERAVLRDQQLMFVYLAPGWTNLNWASDFAWKIVKVWPEIVSEVQRAREPTIFEVAPKSLKVSLMQKVRDIR